MSDQGPGRHPGEEHLLALRGELARRGMACDLREGGRQPQLPVWYRGADTADEPLDSVAVTFIRGQWWYCWPEVTPISPVAPVSQAADAIISELRLGDDAGDGGQVTDLAAWRALRRLPPGIFGPDAPGDRGSRASQAGMPPPAGPARDGPPGTPETLVTRPEVMLPGRVLGGLRTELAARGLTTAGMTVTRLQGTLTMAAGSSVVCCCGWLFWPAGRLSAGGRPLYAVHRAGDPAGAARRLARPRPRNG